MKKIIVFLLITLSIKVSAQITFEKKLSGVTPSYVEQTKDGGYIIAGTIYSGTYWNIYLMKTNPVGDTLWTKTFGGTISDGAISVKQTKDGGYIIGGATTSFGAGGSDFYLVKTDSLGNLLWSKTIGGTGGEFVNFAQQTTDGGYIVGGTTNSFGAGGYDVYIVKTDSVGVTQWTKTYGGINNEQITSFQQTTDGGYIISGASTTVFLIKTNSIGDTLWCKNYRGISVSHSSIPSSNVNYSGGYCKQTTDGGYIVSGSVIGNSGPFTSSAFYYKTDLNGNIIWAKNIVIGWGTCYSSNSSIVCMQQTNDKGFIFNYGGSASCGGMGPNYSEGFNTIFKTDSNGTGVWSNSYNPVNIHQSTDSGYVIVENWSDSILLIKTDKNGSTICNISSTGSGGDSVGVFVSDTSFTISSGGSSSNPATQVGSSSETITTICTSVASIKQYQSNNEIRIYPNPNNGSFVIEPNNAIKQSMQVYDVTGKLVLSQIINGRTNIDASSLNEGIYNISIISNEGVVNKRVVIVR